MGFKPEIPAKKQPQTQGLDRAATGIDPLPSFITKNWFHRIIASVQIFPPPPRVFAVVQLVEALRYKQEGRWFDFRWCHWKLSLTQFFQTHYGPGADSTSNRNEYQEYFLGGKGCRCVGLTLPPSCAECLEIWEPQPPGTLRACPVMGLLYLLPRVILQYYKCCTVGRVAQSI